MKKTIKISFIQSTVILGPLEIKAFKTLMTEIEASIFGCIAILPRLTSLSVVIDDLFNESIEQYLHYKVSEVDKVLTIVQISDMSSKS